MAVFAEEALQEYFNQNPKQIEFFQGLSEEDKVKFCKAVIKGAQTSSKINEEAENFADGVEILLEQLILPNLQLLKERQQDAKATVQAILDICSKETLGKEMLKRLPEFLNKKGFSELISFLPGRQEQDRDR